MGFTFNFGKCSLLNGESVFPECNDTSCKFKYPCSDKKTCSGYKIKLKPGQYIFEVFGSQGGSVGSESGLGGFGGYSRAVITIPTFIPLYLYVGSRLDFNDCRDDLDGICGPSFNGGGPGYLSGSGGGSTDFRMSENDTHTRFLIAGGGGAAWRQVRTASDFRSFDKHHQRRTIKSWLVDGGIGGGITGAGSFSNYHLHGDITGGGQFDYGIGYTNGSFGNGCAFHNERPHGGSGGGLFGGSCGLESAGTGGSGFVYSENRTNLITEIKSISIENGELIDGVNEGDGYAIITPLFIFSNEFKIRRVFYGLFVIAILLKSIK